MAICVGLGGGKHRLCSFRSHQFGVNDVRGPSRSFGNGRRNNCYIETDRTRRWDSNFRSNPSFETNPSLRITRSRCNRFGPHCKTSPDPRSQRRSGNQRGLLPAYSSPPDTVETKVQSTNSISLIQAMAVQISPGNKR